MIKNKLKNWATSGSPSSRLVYFLLLICLSISGLCTLLLPLTLLQLMDKWPGIRGTYFIEPASLSTTQGRITRSEVVSDYMEHAGDVLRYQIAYEFEYGGKRYSSDQITFKNDEDAPPEYVQGLVVKYPLGSEVTVYFLPDEPTLSVLEPNLRGGYKLLLVSIGIGLTNVPAIVSFLISKKRSGGR